MKGATVQSSAPCGRVLGLSFALALTAVPAIAQEVDHAAMGHAPPQTGDVDHAAMGHGRPQHHGHAMDTGLPADAPINPVPPITPSDREAAFPDVAGHHVHDDSIHSFWLLDRLEAWDADTGTDNDRLWLRSEGERLDGTTGSADIEVLYGRAIAPWWDLVAGVRHDFGEGPSQTFAAIGVQGLSPYKFEVGATAYVGESGQTAASLEVEYETLFTNHLILQSMAGAELHGKDDPRRGIGSGLGTVEVGLRLRYEVTRQFAPYVGVAHERAFGKTADLHRAAGEDVDDSRVVAGLRLWF